MPDSNPPSISFVQAHSHNYRPGRPSPGRIRGMVLHSEESPETEHSTESIQAYFAQANTRVGAAHYEADSNTIGQSVRDNDEAWHAPGVNATHLGIEQAGYARQTSAEWHDPYSWAMIRLVAAFVAAKAAQYGFPLVFRTAADLVAGRIDGITTHAEVSAAFHQSTHTDPGDGYPIAEFMAMVTAGPHTVAPPPAAHVFRLNDRGAGVAFLADMANIMAAAGFCLNAKGKPSHVQLPVPKDPKARASFVYDAHVRERVAEIERFGHAMWKMAGSHGPDVAVDGVAGRQVASLVAFWVPRALAAH